MDAVLAGLVLPDVQNHSLAVLADAVRGAGHAVAVAPFGGFRDIEAVAQQVIATGPRLFGLSMQTTETALASATLLEVLRRRGYRGLIVAGGHFATLNAHALLREVKSIDAVVRFAGEPALLALLRGGLAQDPSRLPGVIMRDAAGAIREGGPPVVQQPRRSFVFSQGEQPIHLGFGAADLVLSRGCEAHCGYCCVAGLSDLAAAHGPRASRLAVDAIADEMAALFHERDVRVFNFMDDNLLPMDAQEAQKWVDALGAALRRRRVGRIAFSLQLRADVCTKEVVGALADLGFVRGYVGIDGYSGRQLTALGRSAPAEAGPEALCRLSEAGIFSVCNALIIGPTFRFENVCSEIEALARVRHAPVHLLPIDVRAGSAYFERVRHHGLLEGGTLSWRYRFADPRTARMAEALTSLPTRLEEYSVPVALYDLGYNLGIARRLLPEVDVDDACAIYKDVTARWNADQLRVLRAAAAAAATGEPAAITAFREAEGPRVRALDDELRACCAAALRSICRAASSGHGAPVRPHLRGKLISSLTLSTLLAACTLPSMPEPPDAAVLMDGAVSAADLNLGSCPDGKRPQSRLPDSGCGEVQADVTFDASGVPIAVHPADGGMLSPEAQSCIQSLLSGYCYPSYAGTTQTLISHHFWIA